MASYTFITGSQVTPFAKISQKPIELLESATSADLSMAVPFVRITEIDPTTKAPVLGQRPIMFDLTENPQFGESVESRLERPLVSLERIQINTKQNYGFSQFSEVEISFTVHKPEVVFSDSKHSTWKSLTFRGGVFMLEYGWSGAMNNDLFNGAGYFDRDSGLLVPAVKFLLLRIVNFNLSIGANGEMKFMMSALENGEIGLRNIRLGESTGVTNPSNKELHEMIAGTINGVPRTGNGFVKFKDVADALLAPLIIRACLKMGYSDVNLYLGNFGNYAGSTTKEYGNINLSGKSIGEFLLPHKLLLKTLGDNFKAGETITLFNFISIVMNEMNGNPWRFPPGVEKKTPPVVAVKTNTISDGGKLIFNFMFLDQHEGSQPFGPNDKLELDKQSETDVIRKLRDKKVPLMRYGHGFSYVEQSNFQIVTEQLAKSMLIEKAFADRKDRTERTTKPDPLAKDEQPRQENILPLSIVQGDIDMIGNFVFENFALVWIDFFGLPSISGPFSITGRSDSIEPGGFKTKISVMSDGTDPLNTRRRMTPEEEKRKAEELERQKKKNAEKEKKRGS